ncbi:MAG: TonB family protein [Gemmatimonadota bacterium]|nr:TonB family protein [Gemmatimonadota bacterium]
MPQQLPPRPWITGKIVRTRRPEADLKAQYRKVFPLCVGISLALHAAVAFTFPAFRLPTPTPARHPILIQATDVPETRQGMRLPVLVRPTVPLETDSRDLLPEELTVAASAELDFDAVSIRLSAPPDSQTAAPYGDEEVVGEVVLPARLVERKPRLLEQVEPAYPEEARRAGLEGVVLMEFTVGKDGRVKDSVVLKGHEVFHEASLDALSRFRYLPGYQNREAVEVRMFIYVRFQLD